MAVIVAAGESSKTDTRKIIEKQQQLLDDIKKCPTSDEDVAMKDDGRTASTGVTRLLLYNHLLLFNLISEVHKKAQ